MERLFPIAMSGSRPAGQRGKQSVCRVSPRKHRGSDAYFIICKAGSWVAARFNYLEVTGRCCDLKELQTRAWRNRETGDQNVGRSGHRTVTDPARQCCSCPALCSLDCCRDVPSCPDSSKLPWTLLSQASYPSPPKILLIVPSKPDVMCSKVPVGNPVSISIWPLLLDDCNSLWTGPPVPTLDLLQEYVNMGARVILLKYKSCPVSLFKTLRWLPISLRVKAQVLKIFTLPSLLTGSYPLS